MNWLAHLYLSGPDPGQRLGNLLPDLLSPGQLGALPAEYQAGIAQHRRIDAFTDAHPVVRRGIARIRPPFRRFGGILCDLFYDHFLASGWEAHSQEPLASFAEGVYATFGRLEPLVPAEAFERLGRMRTHNWLCAYADLAGLRRALERTGSRFGRPVELGPAIAVLEDGYEDFRADFNAFFPDLRAHAGR